MNGSSYFQSIIALCASAVFGGIVATSQQSQAPAVQPQAPAQEVDLVRKLYDARDNYQASLERLRSYYTGTASKEKLAHVEKELIEYHLQIKNPFLLELDLPAADLKPENSIPAANKLYSDAIGYLGKRSLMDRGGDIKRSELLFRKLLREYPRSDKLDETCYYLGEIYSSKYYQQFDRAVAYYERVILYERNSSLDARIRAARIYEKHLKEKRRAIELYEEVLRRESDQAQMREATKRLEELTGIRSTAR